MSLPIVNCFEKNKQLSYYLNRRTNRKIYRNFSFVPDPDLPPWTKVEDHLLKIPLCKYYNRLAGENFHDLCLYNHPPHNSGELLGLGLKFCIQSRRPYSKPMTESFDRLERDICLRYFFATSNYVDPDLDIIPNYKHRRKLYVKSKWIPPVACKQVEDRIRVFEKHIVLNIETFFLK